METDVLEPWHGKATRRLNAAVDMLLSGPNWSLKALGAVLALSLFRAFPNYDALQTNFFQTTWRDVQLKFDHPLLDTGRIFPAGSHASNLTFRLTVPILAHLLRLHRDGLLILFALIGIALLYLILKVAYTLSASKRVALFVCLSTSCAWPGATAFQDLRGGYYDALALCLLIAACATESPLGCGILLFLAAWTDERALLASAFVFLLNALNNKSGIRGLLRGKSAAVVIAASAYLGIRAYLTVTCSYAVPTGVGFAILAQQVRVIPLAIWTGLAGSWILVVLGLMALFQQKRYVAGVGFGAALLAMIGASVLVTDMTRSMSYCLPAVFVALAALNSSGRIQHLERLAAIAAAISFIVPTYYLEGATGFFWLYPLPMQLVRWL